jgi:hypothetical protein
MTNCLNKDISYSYINSYSLYHTGYSYNHILNSYLLPYCVPYHYDIAIPYIQLDTHKTLFYELMKKSKFRSEEYGNKR